MQDKHQQLQPVVNFNAEMSHIPTSHRENNN